MATNLLSSNVEVFPTSKRSSVDVQSRLTTEKNLTAILRAITSKCPNDGFVTSYDTNTHLLSFVLGGYMFTIKNTSVITGPSSGESALYAFINVSQGESGYTELVGTDSDSGYTGLSLTTSLTDATTRGTYHLLIATASGGQWVFAPRASLQKFTQADVVINDGTINI